MTHTHQHFSRNPLNELNSGQCLSPAHYNFRLDDFDLASWMQEDISSWIGNANRDGQFDCRVVFHCEAAGRYLENRVVDRKTKLSVLFGMTGALIVLLSNRRDAVSASETLLSPDKTQHRPNIVFILADDLGYGDVRCLNPVHGKIATPHLDRLAEQGTVFTEAHSSSAVCTPSRYSILTGRYGWRTRLQSGVLGGFSPPLIERERLTLPEMLRQQGYYTACVGKWHLGMTMPGKSGTIMRDAIETFPSKKMDWSRPIEDGPTTRGFDAFFGISASLDMPPFAFIEGNRITQTPTTVKKWIREGPASPDFEAVDVLPVCSLRAQEMITERSREVNPFFLYLSLTSPHTPIEVTNEWHGKSGLGAYADFVMQTDAVVGEIMAAVDRAGIAANTLFLFASDNGYSPAGAIVAEHRPSADRRGYKADVWDGGHRVPLIVRWPRRVPKGSRCHQLVCLSDLMATCADLQGVKLPPEVAEDSVSLTPLFRDPTRPVRDDLVNHSISGKFALRELSWKLILCPGSGGWAAPTDEKAVRDGLPLVQLYHLETDPGETKNLQAQHPERVRRMITRLQQLVDNGRSTLGPNVANDSPVDLWKRETLPTD